MSTEPNHLRELLKREIGEATGDPDCDDIVEPVLGAIDRRLVKIIESAEDKPHLSQGVSYATLLFMEGTLEP